MGGENNPGPAPIGVRMTANSNKILLFLDFDGTLTPIRSRPEKARLTEANRGKLRRLLGQPLVKTVIISGRKLDVLKRLVGIPGFIYVGNHGFEMEVGGKHRTVAGAKKHLKVMRLINDALQKGLKIKGCLIENKGLTLSVHYRMIAKTKLKEFYRLFAEIMKRWRKAVKVTRGKAVYEVRPPLDWDKGRAVLWLIKELKLSAYQPIYIGDDKTDEDAFKALKGKGLSILVGRGGRTAADRRLGTIGDVYRLIGRFA